jgi:hypothetical protein
MKQKKLKITPKRLFVFRRTGTQPLGFDTTKTTGDPTTSNTTTTTTSIVMVIR